MAKIIPGKNGSKQDVITKKASILFIEKGFTATSMRDIAESIGVEAPSLYNHIGSKNEILQKICFNIANSFIEHLLRVESSRQTAIKKAELIIRFHIQMMLDEHEGVYISDHEWKHLPEPFLSDFKEQRKSYRLRLAEIINQGIKNKELKNTNAYVAVLTILSAIGGIENWQRSKKHVDAKTLEEDMVGFLIDGLKMQDNTQIKTT